MSNLSPADLRDSALDFTKGALVLLMVFYHWMNYFVGVEGPAYSYLRFIPPSFIFISGFLLVKVYPSKYGLNQSRLYRRLLVRGLKILTLFTLLNVAANMLFSTNYRGALPGVETFVSNAASIYLSGNGRMIFGILLPISYLLIISTLIFLSMLVSRHALTLVCAVSQICVVLMEYHDISNPNMSFIAIGILGMAVGELPSRQISSWAARSWMLVGLYGGHLIVIHTFGETYPLQIMGMCLGVLLLYGLGTRVSQLYPLGNTLVMLGKYSLFAYVAQIALLQLLQAGLGAVHIHHLLRSALSFISIFTLTICAVWGTHRICSKSATGYRVYRLVFT